MVGDSGLGRLIDSGSSIREETVSRRLRRQKDSAEDAGKESVRIIKMKLCEVSLETVAVELLARIKSL